MDSSSQSSDGSNWSRLPLDLLHMIFERLGFADFGRAKSVCSSWRYVARQTAPNNQIPWLILFPDKGKDHCLLFNPEEKEKIYNIQNPGANFANSRCMAVCGSWLFMRDLQYNLYIMNIFTRERINLPSIELQHGMIKIIRTIDGMFRLNFNDEEFRFRHNDIEIKCPLLWIDEKTKDYVAMWIIHTEVMVLVYSRKEDSVWKQIELFGIIDMVFKDHKLYLYDTRRDVKVLDFSGDIPRQIMETQVNYDSVLAKGLQLGDCDVDDVRTWLIKKDHLVVSVTGEILKVKSIVRNDSDVWSFRIYKMDSSNSDWEKLASLGNEAVLLDQGITVLANATEGVNRNSIYFSGNHPQYYHCFRRDWSENDIFIFNLETQKVERPHQNICASIQSHDARWFVPNFKWK